MLHIKKTQVLMLLKIDDGENRSRRNNLRIKGLPISNADQVGFVEDTLLQLAESTEGMLILGGDLDPRLDVLPGASHLSYSTLRRIKRALHSDHLIDVWRLKHLRS